MEFLVMLVLLAGGGLFAYRQWNAIRAEAQPRRTERYPVRATVIQLDEPAYPAVIEPEILPSPSTPHRPTAAPARPRINKWVLFGLAVLYVICPLDGDFIPVVGWIDDAVVMAMGIKALMDQRP